MRARLGLAVVLVSLLLPAGVALAHGKEDEALEKTPARALAQQALALLGQENKAAEAQERIEAAVESKDREGVDVALLRRTEAAFERGDQAAATRLIAEALGADGAEVAPAVGHEEDGDTAAANVDAAAFEHRPEFEPGRGAPEWLAVGVGVLAVLVGGSLLLRFRGRPA